MDEPDVQAALKTWWVAVNTDFGGVALSDRGLLKAGMAADITVFDPATVADKATFEQPHQPSVGLAYVFVNGQKVLDHGKLTAARPGRGLRGPGYVPPEQRGRK